jgi:hypothetical protein
LGGLGPAREVARRISPGSNADPAKKIEFEKKSNPARFEFEIPVRGGFSLLRRCLRAPGGFTQPVDRPITRARYIAI